MKRLLGVSLFSLCTGAALCGPPSPVTSVDLYCESMTVAFFEAVLDYKPPSSQARIKKLEEAENEMLQTCKSMPVVGGVTKLVRDMTPKEVTHLSCLAIADGISTAFASKAGDSELYSKIAAKRSFFSSACSSNRKAFLSDMRNYGPRYVLDKKY
jgi:hypothetical protein